MINFSYIYSEMNHNQNIIASLNGVPYGSSQPFFEALNLNEMKEIWKDIEGYKGCYQISNFGRVRSYTRKVENRTNIVEGKILNPVTTHDGYLRITLSLSAKAKSFTIHRLVAKAFVKNPKKEPCVNHIDGNKLNNRINNLEWCTVAYNNKHAYSIGIKSAKGEKNGISKLKPSEVLSIVEMCNKGIIQKDVGRAYGVSRQTVSSIMRGVNWNHLTNIKR